MNNLFQIGTRITTFIYSYKSSRYVFSSNLLFYKIFIKLLNPLYYNLDFLSPAILSYETKVQGDIPCWLGPCIHTK